MAKTKPTTTSTEVRDPKTGNFQTVRGVGALKGRLTLDRSVDLNKPIASQVMKAADLARTLRRTFETPWRGG